jgi:hypothetical protein
MGAVFLIISGFLSARLVNRFGVKPIIISGMALQTIGYLFLYRSLLQKATLEDCSDQCSL